MLEEEHISSELKGNTLRVYWKLLKAPDGKIGVRETQRKLRFSSPHLAQYHLEKLIDLGLVEKKYGDYHLVRRVKVDILKQFISIGTIMIPRFTMYAVMFSILLFYFLLNIKILEFYTIYALLFGFLATLILWYETIRTWLQRLWHDMDH